MRRIRPSVALLFLAAAVTPAMAREGVSDVGQGWHVVRPGDTLEGITARYLGSPSEWRENWKLNTWIRNPDLLQPGERLRVLLRPTASQPAAQVRNVRRSVDEMPTPIPWKAASEDDILVVRDGLRTDSNSSAELAFTDGTSLRVAEDSLVFLGSSRTQRTWNRDVEIVRGQTDVATSPSADEEDQVELVLGPALARARGASGSGRLRARRPETGAQVMVYEGSGDVAAGGSRVQLAAGTGSAVPEKGPPSPAEPLLAAPTLERPESGASLGGNPRFSWQGLPQAQSYLIEFCHDAACSDVVRRVDNLRQSSWTAANLEPGAYFWRVSARSATGLDGYPSPSAGFTVASVARDLAAPTVALSLAGSEIARAGVRYVPAAVPLEIKASDDQALESTETLVNGQPIAVAELRSPWRGGAYSVMVRGTDRAGNTVASPVVSFTVDDVAPSIEWQVTSSRVLRERGAPMLVAGKVLRDASRAARIHGSAFSLSADGGRWLNVDFAQQGSVWRGLSMEPQVFLLAVEDHPLGTGSPQLEAGQILWIRAVDVGAGVASMELSVRVGEAGSSELAVTAVDRVGNTVESRWPLAAAAHRP
jgi:hypothetical protein